LIWLWVLSDVFAFLAQTRPRQTLIRVPVVIGTAEIVWDMDVMSTEYSFRSGNRPNCFFDKKHRKNCLATPATVPVADKL
jgi:hypothetical protein